MEKFRRLGVTLLLGSISHVAIAEGLPQVINKFKQTCVCAGCDLAGANLANFRPAEDLRFLPNIDNNDFSFKKCNLVRANMAGANLRNTNFNANIPRYRTAPKALDYESVLAGSDFSFANFTGTNLRDSKLVGIIAKSANFQGGNLSGGDLTQADFARANFAQANLRKTKAKIDVMHGFQADFRHANFNGADLAQARLCGSFAQASFKNANLKGAILQSRPTPDGAVMWQGADFSGANLTGADIGGHGQLRQSGKQVHASVLAQAKFCRTTMPDGQINNRDC